MHRRETHVICRKLDILSFIASIFYSRNNCLKNSSLIFSHEFRLWCHWELIHSSALSPNEKGKGSILMWLSLISSILTNMDICWNRVRWVCGSSMLDLVNWVLWRVFMIMLGRFTWCSPVSTWWIGSFISMSWQASNLVMVGSSTIFIIMCNTKERNI